MLQLHRPTALEANSTSTSDLHFDEGQIASPLPLVAPTLFLQHLQTLLVRYLLFGVGKSQT